MISINAARQMLRDAGAERISKNSALKLKKILEEYAKEIAKEAIKNAQYSGRKVVKSEDIKEVIKEFED